MPARLDGKLIWRFGLRRGKVLQVLRRAFRSRTMDNPMTKSLDPPQPLCFAFSSWRSSSPWHPLRTGPGSAGHLINPRYSPADTETLRRIAELWRGGPANSSYGRPFTTGRRTAVGAVIAAWHIFFSFLLCLVIGAVYRHTHKSLSYPQSFVHTLVIAGVVITVVMMVIGNSIAIALGIFGAFSLIRFRTAIKEPRDVAFLFFALAVGMAVGTYNVGSRLSRPYRCASLPIFCL